MSSTVICRNMIQFYFEANIGRHESCAAEMYVAARRIIDEAVCDIPPEWDRKFGQDFDPASDKAWSWINEHVMDASGVELKAQNDEDADKLYCIVPDGEGGIKVICYHTHQLYLKDGGSRFQASYMNKYVGIRGVLALTMPVLETKGEDGFISGAEGVHAIR